MKSLLFCTLLIFSLDALAKARPNLFFLGDYGFRYVQDFDGEPSADVKDSSDSPSFGLGLGLRVTNFNYYNISFDSYFKRLKLKPNNRNRGKTDSITALRIIFSLGGEDSPGVISALTGFASHSFSDGSELSDKGMFFGFRLSAPLFWTIDPYAEILWFNLSKSESRIFGLNLGVKYHFGL